jgi:hypothetical protein
MGFGWVNGFIDHLYTRLGTTSNYSRNANFHILRITTCQPSSVCGVFTSRCLVTALSSRDSSTSVLTSLLSDEYPTTELSNEIQRPHFSAFLAELNGQPNSLLQTALLITSRQRPHRKQPVSIAVVQLLQLPRTGTCLPCRCPETALYIRPSLGNCISTAINATVCIHCTVHTVINLNTGFLYE